MKVSPNILLHSIISILLLFSIVGCNNCDCDERKELYGSYECLRGNAIGHEYLKLFKNGLYVHEFLFDSVKYINSNRWDRGVNPYTNIDVVNFYSWVSPCSILSVECYKTLDVPSKFRNKDHLLKKREFEFGCLKGLDDQCAFRIFDESEPMYNYSSVNEENELNNIQRVFLSSQDSIMFSLAHKDDSLLFPSK